MIELVGIGELLIDFTPVMHNGETHYKQNAGGAPCNMLTMAQLLGTSTAFIGKVGKDKFGSFLKASIENKGVGTQGLILSEEHNTTLAFVHLDPSGERSFSFYRRGCADVMLDQKDINYALIDEARMLHFGSLSFTDEPAASTVLSVLEYARGKNKLITYDPNYRPALWPCEEAAVKAMRKGFEYADVVKVSDEEAKLLTGKSDLFEAAGEIFSWGVKLVAITLGKDGALVYHRNIRSIVQGFESNVVDTTGAGDSFFGSLVHCINKAGKSVEDLNAEELTGYFRLANAAASLCIEGYGGIPSMPGLDAVRTRLESI